MLTALRTPPAAETPARAPYAGPAAKQILLLAQQLGLGPALPTQRKLIGVTSTARSAGATTIAKGLAATIAGWSPREVLLVDAHHAQPTLSRIYNAAAGLTQVCLVQQELEQVVASTEVSNLLLLGSGDLPETPLSADALLCACAARFDHVIVDLPPLQHCHQTLPLWAALDGVVLVVESERVTRSQLAAAREFLERLEVPLLGAVLNKERHVWPRWLRWWRD